MNLSTLKTEKITKNAFFKLQKTAIILVNKLKQKHMITFQKKINQQMQLFWYSTKFKS